MVRGSIKSYSNLLYLFLLKSQNAVLDIPELFILGESADLPYSAVTFNGGT